MGELTARGRKGEEEAGGEPHLDVGVGLDQRRGHLQGEVVVFPPVQHEGHTLLPHHLPHGEV